jgi:hypothetical protein
MWHVVQIWLASGPKRRVEIAIHATNLAVVLHDDLQTELETVRNEEDPSRAVIRAMQRLRSAAV